MGHDSKESAHMWEEAKQEGRGLKDQRSAGRSTADLLKVAVRSSPSGSGSSPLLGFIARVKRGHLLRDIRSFSVTEEQLNYYFYLDRKGRAELGRQEN